MKWSSRASSPILFRFAHHNRPSWKQGGKRSQSGSRSCVCRSEAIDRISQCSSPWPVCYPSVGSTEGTRQ
jgi:hypothetical protein